MPKGLLLPLNNSIPERSRPPKRQPSDRHIKEMEAHILELHKGNQYLKDERIWVTGEPSRPNSPKGPISTEELQILGQRDKDLKREEKHKALTKVQEDRDRLNSISKAKSS